MAYKVTKYFLEVFGERISAGDPRVIEELVEAGCLGRKSGKGGSYTFSFLLLYYCFVDLIFCNSVGCILYMVVIDISYQQTITAWCISIFGGSTFLVVKLNGQ